MTTAAIPGRPAPKIITAAMVAGMKPGSVIVDLAAETGGNCEATRPGETIDIGGVTVAGPLNLASMGALHASEMYARNVYNFLALMLGKDGELKLDWDDELVAKTCLARDGQVAPEPGRGAAKPGPPRSQPVAPLFRRHAAPQLAQAALLVRREARAGAMLPRIASRCAASVRRKLRCPSRSVCAAPAAAAANVPERQDLRAARGGSWSQAARSSARSACCSD